jgi:type VI protein secretion system component Hcp
MPGVAFLVLDGINGESQTVQNAIELESYSFAASNPANLGNDGMSGGTASLSDFSFTCEVDSSSGNVLNQLFTGMPIKTATFTLVESTGAQQQAQPPYVTVTFTNCYITNQSFSGSGLQGKPAQSISFAYEQIQYAYSKQSDDGNVTNASNAGFNVAKGQTVS